MLPLWYSVCTHTLLYWIVTLILRSVQNTQYYTVHSTCIFQNITFCALRWHLLSQWHHVTPTPLLPSVWDQDSLRSSCLEVFRDLEKILSQRPPFWDSVKNTFHLQNSHPHLIISLPQSWLDPQRLLLDPRLGSGFSWMWPTTTLEAPPSDWVRRGSDKQLLVHSSVSETSDHSSQDRVRALEQQLRAAQQREHDTQHHYQLQLQEKDREMATQARELIEANHRHRNAEERAQLAEQATYTVTQLLLQLKDREFDPQETLPGQNPPFLLMCSIYNSQCMAWYV